MRPTCRPHKNLQASCEQNLAQRLADSPRRAAVELLCGDCAEAIKDLHIPRNALTLAFIDPTGIGHAPFSLIQGLQRHSKTDLHINIQHGMGSKMNMHQYTPDSKEESALTKFLGHDGWKTIPRPVSAKTFFVKVMDMYRDQLRSLGYIAGGREVLISKGKNLALYLMLFAGKNIKGTEFWDKSIKGVEEPELGPEFQF